MLLFFSALLIGISKTGIQGIGMLTVPIMAVAFGAKPSTGLILPMLCFADLIAVFYYRRVAEWRYIFKLLPSALFGFGVAILVDKMIPPEGFKLLLGICLLFAIFVMLWFEWKGQQNTWTNHWWYGPLFGLLGGFTTMIGNAAGPVMAIYLLSVKMPKLSFIGTNAWFFLVVNYLKLPIQVWVWDNITISTLTLNLIAVPFILIGGYLGVKLIKILPEKQFRIFTTIVTCLSVLLLLF
ncbi:MAG: sulfite exporter TauE/SafE family protein [Massilibacteroides sp.]|nr:sulfite exporter TauE/SafE family protein [Massilibacteroides sp.]